jgi:perosamine synthetase
MKIPLCIPDLGPAETQSVADCLASGWVSSAGPQLSAFAGKCAEAAGRKYAVPVVNGTSALHLALLVAGVKPGEEVLIPSLAFIAPANAIRYVGAEPLFVDADPLTWQMDVQVLRRFLEQETEVKNGICFRKESGRKIAALLIVDVLGHLGPMDEYLQLAEQYHLVLLEDAAEALGSRYKGHPAGSFGLISTLSFNGNKIVTTGGGGMLLTDDPVFAARALHLSTQAKLVGVEYAHDEVGYNFRMPALNAALGMAQMNRLPQFLRRKREVFEYYNQQFEGLAGVCPFRPASEGLEPNHWLYTLAANDSRKLQAYLADREIETRKLWQPLHQQAPFTGNFLATRNHAAGKIYESSLSLPCSTSITDPQLEAVADAVKAFYRK